MNDNVPEDPCDNLSCGDGLGYIYIAPAAVPNAVGDDDYQIYATLERQTAKKGYSSNGSEYVTLPDEDEDELVLPFVPVPTNFSISKVCGGSTYMNDATGDNNLIYHLFAYKTINSQVVYSSGTTQTFYERGPGPFCGNYYLEFNWTFSSDVDGYRVVIGHDDNFGYNGQHYINSPGSQYPAFYPALRYGIYQNPGTFLDPMVPPIP